MSLYIIYHMVGIKVGCTKDLDARSLQNRMRYGMDAEIVVLEEVTDAKLAGDRERYWTEHFGYRHNGPHYTQSLDALSAMGKSGARSPHPPAAATHDVRVTCQHCGKTGQARAMLRYHFDRCKQKKESCYGGRARVSALLS